jgi:ferredoxin-type protein NapH
MSTKSLRYWINTSNVSRFRLIIQILLLVFFLFGGYYGITISEKIPTFACPYNTYSPATCYMISIQHEMNMTWSDFISFRGLGFVVGLITFLLFFIFLNKAWCGYACPIGTIQDLITKFRAKLGIRFSRYNSKEYKLLSKLKYLFLILAIAIPLFMANSFFGAPKLSHDYAAPFCQVCPGRLITPAMTGDFSQFHINFRNNTTIIFSVLGVIFTAIFFVGSFVKRRFFCLICPMSALNYIFSKLALLRLVKDGNKCTKCGNCSRVCDIGIKEIETDLTSKNLVTENCMLCMKCVEACPENNCLSIKFAGIKILNSTDYGFIKRYGITKYEKLNQSINDKKS